jgi:hydroxymethylpyrimidine pyrophosphatase-like HAD family hydrolase
MTNNLPNVLEQLQDWFNNKSNQNFGTLDTKYWNISFNFRDFNKEDEWIHLMITFTFQLAGFSVPKIVQQEHKILKRELNEYTSGPNVIFDILGKMFVKLLQNTI